MRVFLFFFFFLSVTNKSNWMNWTRSARSGRCHWWPEVEIRRSTIFNLIKQRTKICVSSIEYRDVSIDIKIRIRRICVLVQRSNWTRSVFFLFFSFSSVQCATEGPERTKKWERMRKKTQPAPSSQRVRTSRAFFPLLSVRDDEGKILHLVIFLIEWQLRVFSTASGSRTKRRLNYNIIESRWRMINDKHGE